MRVFFDVDHTILGTDGTLRPGTLETFTRLVNDGHEIYVWSGMGLRHAELACHGLEHLVQGVFHKPVGDFHAGHEKWGLPFAPDFVVDDHPGIVVFLGGMHVTAYLDKERGDDGAMAAVYDAIAACSSTRG